MIPPPLRTQVRHAIDRAWTRAIDDGALPPPDDGTRPGIEVERPANPEHGDFATNLAMKLARPYRRSPLELATLLAAKLVRDGSAPGSTSPIEAAEVAPPGFLNVRLRPVALEAIVDGILAEPEAWGHVEPVSTRSVNVEFVSANPTGPLHIGNARGAFIGDLLSRVLEAGGRSVRGRSRPPNDMQISCRPSCRRPHKSMLPLSGPEEAGAYLLTNQVTVTSGYWRLLGYNAFGLSLLPLLFGIGLLFFNGRSIAGWLLTFAGVVIILVGIIARAVLFTWVFLRTRGSALLAIKLGKTGEPPTHPELLDWLAATGCARVAIHFDVDTIDSNEIMLGLGAEPGGLTTAQVRRIVEHIDAVADVVGVTVAEFIPRQVMHLQQLLTTFPLLRASTSI